MLPPTQRGSQLLLEFLGEVFDYMSLGMASLINMENLYMPVYDENSYRGPWTKRRSFLLKGNSQRNDIF